jgi:hypothetical protein
VISLAIASSLESPPPLLAPRGEIPTLLDGYLDAPDLELIPFAASAASAGNG